MFRSESVELDAVDGGLGGGNDGLLGAKRSDAETVECDVRPFATGAEDDGREAKGEFVLDAERGRTGRLAHEPGVDETLGDRVIDPSGERFRRQ